MLIFRHTRRDTIRYAAARSARYVHERTMMQRLIITLMRA